MTKKTKDIRQSGSGDVSIDAIDRKLLGALSLDASLSYASLGDRIGLSAPATHERVKRLKASGVIRRVTADIDPQAIGKTVLAFVHVDTNGWGGTPEILALQKHPEIEEIHSVAGDTSMLLKIRVSDSKELELILSELYAMPGVKATRSYVVLSTYLERGVHI